MLNLAQGFVNMGRQVDIVLCKAKGAYLGEIPERANLVVLKGSWQLKERLYAASIDRGEFFSLLRPVLLAKKNAPEVSRLQSLSEYIDRERPDVILAALSYANLAALWARKASKYKPPIIISERNALFTVCKTPEKHRKWRWRYLPELVRRSYPLASDVIAVSHHVEKELCEDIGLPADLVKTIHNPVVDDRLRTRAQEPLDHPWFVPGSPPVILGVGRLQVQKDFATLLRAFALVRKRKTARLVILGEGSERANLEKLAVKLGIKSDLYLAGFVDNPFKYMANASQVVLSSKYEGLPGVLIQAMAVGCPVVSTDCPGGSADILENGKYGPLVPVGDAQALSEAMLAQLQNPQSADSLKDRAEDFSVDRAVDTYLGLIDAALGRAKTAAGEPKDQDIPLSNNKLKPRTAD